ncbi:MAG: response regulator [Denitrovibrio sp.]|nr:MAG: response regulator [Denitrovibrio sp.]
MNFLIADDDLVTRHMLAALLKEYGQTSEASNGKEVITAYKLSQKGLKPFDALFIDIMMPVMDGKEAVSQIRAIEKIHGVAPDKEAKIIMLSALDDPKNVMDSFYNSGATSYLIKPINAEKLKKELTKLNLL